MITILSALASPSRSLFPNPSTIDAPGYCSTYCGFSKSTTVLEWGIAKALDLLAMAVLLSRWSKTSDESATNPSNQSRQAAL
jgi:hypothetical protein